MDSLFIMLIALHTTNILSKTIPMSCPDLPNYIEKLPGLKESSQICNYAGYSFGSPYFYWFMVKVNYTRLMDVPLLVYIGNGAESSLVHIFQPGGPYRLKRMGPDIKVSLANSLLDVGNFLYIEQPGMFSFSKEKFTGDYTVYVFFNEIQRFLESFMNYNGLVGMGKIYVVTEGYMAKIGAMLALSNSRQASNPKYTIQGLIINNGIYDLPIFAESLGGLGAELGTIPRDLLGRIAEETYVTQSMITKNPLEAYRRWESLGKILKGISGLPNFIEDMSDTSSEDKFTIVEDYFSQDEVQKALHIRQMTVWERKAKDSVFQRALPAILNISTPEFSELINSKDHIDIMFNVGVYSPLSSIDGFQQWVKSSEWGGKERIFLANRVFVTDNNSMIYVKEKDNLVYAIHPDDGRLLGSYSLSGYLSAIAQLIKNHTVHGLVEDDAEIETILRECNNHGIFNKSSEQCKCHLNYYGSDCSIKPEEMPFLPYKFSLGPEDWKFFLVDLPEEPMRYKIEQEPMNGCMKKGRSAMVVSADLVKLPTETANDLLQMTGEIVIEKGISEGSKIILGIRNTSPFCEYSITLTKNFARGNSIAVLEIVFVGMFFFLLCLIVSTCAACYVTGRYGKKKLGQLKV